MIKKIIDIDNEFDDLETGFFNESLINRRTANIRKGLKAKAEGTHKGEKNSRYGKPVKPTTRQKLREAMLGKKHTEEAKRKSARPGKLNGMYGIRLTGEQNHFYGKTHNDDVKLHLSKIAKNRPKDQYCIHCNGYYTAQAYGRNHGDFCENNPKRIVKTQKKRDLYGPQNSLICPHCGYEGGEGNMKRYHMDNCEFKGYNIMSYLDGKKYKIYTSLESIENDGINWHKVRNCLLGKSARAYKMEWKKVKK